MGCISSKHAKSARSPPPERDHHRHDHDPHRQHLQHSHSSVTKKARVDGNGEGSGVVDASSLSINGVSGPLERIKEEPEKEVEEDCSVKEQHSVSSNINSKASEKEVKNDNEKRGALISIKFGRLTEGEQAAAGWPAWLSAVAGEAIDGWLPLRSDEFERLAKIGQGTYSRVYRARHAETGKMVALKKVRFDNFEPESVRFMAREITIFRSLDHPNVMKLEGIITSRLSCSIYLVFEYMEHDLSGLLSCPDIKFSESQIKCFMKQLLCGVEHCHSRGVIHRDIKTANILVNNEGILKIADFGLANFVSSKHKQALTSRVVTLWYRPPELLLGSTNYGVTVDLWSVGCVFAELFIGRPLLKGRNEVEQLHKIFKLCGSPSDDYWRKSKLPLATIFKPKQHYESTLRERCKEFPRTAVDLIETFLSMDPSKRGSVLAALESEYFTTKPYACDPSTLPKYPPNKDMDAKIREEVRRKKTGGNSQASRNQSKARRTPEEPSNFSKAVPIEVSFSCNPPTPSPTYPFQQFVVESFNKLTCPAAIFKELDANRKLYHRSCGVVAQVFKGRATDSRVTMKAPCDTSSEASQTTEGSQVDSTVSDPAAMTASSGFALARKEKQDSKLSTSHKLMAIDPLDGHHQIPRHVMHRRRFQTRKVDSCDASHFYKPKDLTADFTDQGRVHSGRALYQSREIDTRQDKEPRQAVRRSRFYRDF